MKSHVIYISSLQHDDIINEFDNVLEKKKYACFFSTDIEKALNSRNNASDHFLLAMPFNKKIHWFIARATTTTEEIVTLDIIDKHVIEGNPVNKVIKLPMNERGLLDNTEFSFSGEVDRDNNDLKIINAIRKNTIGDYDFHKHHENAFMITPRDSNAQF